jgi:hypothetical protein
MILTDMEKLQFEELQEKMLKSKEMCSPMEIAWFAEHVEHMAWYDRVEFFRTLCRHKDQTTFYALKQAMYDHDVAYRPEAVATMEFDPDQLPDCTEVTPYEMRPGQRVDRVDNDEIDRRIRRSELGYW